MSPVPFAAVVVAAGVGSRFSLEVRKSGLEVAGRPLVRWTTSALSAAPGFSTGVLVVHPDSVDEAQAWRPEGDLADPWRIVAGGPTRAESVVAGVRAVEGTADTWVAVHDGARPATAPSEVARVVSAAERAGAAILAHPVSDSLQRAKNGQLETVVDRAGMWASETPQVSTKRQLVAALEASPPWVTDEASALAALGVAVELVESLHPNPKLTVPRDLPIIEALLARA